MALLARYTQDLPGKQKMSRDQLIGQRELALMEDLIPLLHKLAQGQEISGLGAYER